MKNLLVALTMFISSISFADGSKVALGGYCPVAYVKMKKAVFGSPKYASEYKGTLYYFVNEGAKKTFDKNPEEFTDSVKYSAYCATAVSMGKKMPSDPSLFSMVDGRIYFFSTRQAKEMFDKTPSDFISKADQAWPALAKE